MLTMTNVTRMNCKDCPYWSAGSSMNGVMGACSRNPVTVSKPAVGHACGEHPQAQVERAALSTQAVWGSLEKMGVSVPVKQA
jgi:hypothetical protein